jgi:flagellar protein FlaJ
LGIVLLRAKRKLVASGFMNLVIPLHASMSGIIVFIYQIMYSFNNAFAEMMGEHSTEIGGAAESMPSGLSFFNFGASVDLAFIANFVTFVVLILTLASAFASKFASGGSNYKLCFYASLLFFVSAIVLFFVPMMADKLFIIET